ncbi:MAG TPA: alpha-2-macroglobulin family protein [Kofleriaceae bacterium]
MKPLPTEPARAPSSVTKPSGRAQVAIDRNAGEDGALTATLAAASAVSTNAVVTALDPRDTQALLARLEPLPAAATGSPPVIRPASQPPPRTGPVQPIAFVAPAGRHVADKPVMPVQSLAPLAPPQVLPVGEVERESEIRVRFDEPMVPVAAVGKTAMLPIAIKPAVAGTWRWIDTRVAQFSAQAPRLPAATEFSITVAAGAKAISGATLVADVTSTFSTPPVMITGTYPTVQLRPDSPVAVKLDQQIDADAMQKFLRVEQIRTKRAIAFQLTTLAAARTAWAKNPAIKFSEADLGKYYVVLAPKQPWKSGLEARVVLGKSAPSQEGPRVTSRETAASFTIAEAFAARGVHCDDMHAARVTGATCSANGYFSVEFSNDIDPATYRSAKVQIDGERFQDHKPSGELVSLATPARVGRSFSISIGDGIRDIYGQELVGPRKLAFSTSRERFQAQLWGSDGMFVLDPRFDIPQWVLHTQAIASLRVQLFQVQPKDYFAFTEFERTKKGTPPGKKVFDKVYEVGPRHGATARVDLRPALSATGSGHLIALATATAANEKLDDKKRVAWIQVSRVGVTARIDGDKVQAWTQDITPSRFLKPLAGVKATLLVEGRNDKTEATTDSEGHAAFELLPRKPRKQKDDAEWNDATALLLVQQGDQSTFTPINSYEREVREQHVLWYVTDDRFTYKPGEPVYVKGWVRWTNTGVNPDLALPSTKDVVRYTLNDSRGNKIASGNAALTAQGGFDLEVALPANANLGTAYFQLELNGETHRHPISVQEFRTPAYAVTLDDDVTHRGATPLVLGESIEMNTEAKYYAGGGLGGAAIKWHATLEQAAYRPPGWDRYSFSPIRKRSEHDYYWRRRTGDHSTSIDQDTTLSGASASGITFGLAALPAGEPSILSVDATVSDIDRQTIRASSRPILVHPSTLYVGVRLMPEDEGTLQLVATDIDGNAVAGVPIEVTIEGVLGSEQDRDDANVIDKQSCKTKSETSPVTCRFTRKDDKTAYVAVARVADSRGRINAAQYYIPWWTYADSEFAIVPDKKIYKPGDIAKLEVRSQEVPSVAVVSFTRNGVVAQKRVELTKPSATVEMPIEAAYVPNVHVVVDRASKRRWMQGGSNLPIPEHVTTQIDLDVDLESARLSMRTRPLQALVEPGENATFEVEVKHDDKPMAGAEVALMVVDEAVLALSSKSHEDPLGNFYHAVGDGTWSANTLGLVEDNGDELSGKPGFERWSLDDGLHGLGTGSGVGYGGGRGSLGGRSASAASISIGTAVVKARKDFRATAVFSPKLTTDEHGKVRLTVKMPDSLTRFRVVALATAQTRYFGKAESAIVTQRKLNARTVAPRFLTQGDTFALPVVVQNLDRAPRTIDVAVRAANLTLAGPAGKRVTVPGGQRAEVRFELSTHERGRAVVQTIAVAGEFADASNVELPVYEPATTEAFATYGVVDDKPQFEQLKVPADIFADVGGVEAELSSTQLQNLTDAYWYLYAYPFECAEQRSSRMLATTAMIDILDAFATPGRPSKQEIAEQRARDVKKLTRDQLANGGWGYFRGMDADPFVTMQVLTALGAQRESGPVVKNAIGYVTKQANELQAKLDKLVRERDAQRKDRPDDAYAVSLLAASLSSLAAAGVDVGVRADRLHAAATELGVYPIDAKARVLSLVAKQDNRKPMRDKLFADLLSAVHETAGAATVTAQYTESERLLLVSNHKTTALALDAIMREQPQHALVTKLARGLLDGRRRGRWISTQENVVVLQTMRRYFDTYEKDTPNYTGKLWFGNAAYAEQSFVGRSNARGVSQLDWSTLTPGSSHDLVMTKTGPGRMYYRIGITYAPKQTNLPPLDAGFIVRRTYRGADDPKDVTQLADGRVKIKLGARVVVELETVNTSLRYAVALVDPLPAGLESVNTNLATSERAAAGTTDPDWQHTEMRDNRSEAFTMQLREGTHRFSYTARATTPGTFIAAPAKAEEMYSPETFGRSAGTTVVVE